MERVLNEGLMTGVYVAITVNGLKFRFFTACGWSFFGLSKSGPRLNFWPFHGSPLFTFLYFIFYSFHLYTFSSYITRKGPVEGKSLWQTKQKTDQNNNVPGCQAFHFGNPACNGNQARRPAQTLCTQNLCGKTWILFS